MKNFKKLTINSNFICYVNLLSTHHKPCNALRNSNQTSVIAKRKRSSRSTCFAIPDNGWNVVDIELDYYESYYSSTNTQNAFPFRQKFYMIKRSGAGANNISVDVSNALHTDGTNKVIISPFQQGDLL